MLGYVNWREYAVRVRTGRKECYSERLGEIFVQAGPKYWQVGA